ncbi:aminotransferase class V-fold PLP-dependent enzyme [Kiloniella laminariae]|uniref:aminotransferase class V-fold PLP-dependent enzyme n=1 Tax=Kiloniella laminariae TaxID=454162 RepID=UPI00036CD5B4|nr:aminotransferase class V-fold PLP-dependent enzyme [Kiloniella laminariae]
MLDNIRSLFDMPSEVAYLNCAGQSPQLELSRSAGINGIGIKSNPWKLDPEVWNQASDRLRDLFAKLTGATASDIAIIPSTSYGIATAAANLPLIKGQNIVVLEAQFPSNVYAWEKMASERGAELSVVKRPVNYDWTAAVVAQISEATAIAALPPCHWTDGSLLDLVVIGERCREVGAALVVDATQIVGAMPLDVQAIKPDFLVCSAYKWLLCPYSMAFLYVAPKWQSGKAIEHNQFNHKPRDPVTGIVSPKEGAARFDMGERNNFVSLSMAVAAMTQVVAWGPEKIQAALRPLTDLAARHAEDRGWRVPPANSRTGHIIGITFREKLPEKTGEKLARKNIYVGERGGGLRISPYLYNTSGDIEVFFKAMDQLL